MKESLAIKQDDQNTLSHVYFQWVENLNARNQLKSKNDNELCLEPIYNWSDALKHIKCCALFYQN